MTIDEQVQAEAKGMMFQYEQYKWINTDLAKECALMEHYEQVK